MLLMAAVMQKPQANEALDASQEMVVRRCVYDETPKTTGMGPGGFQGRPIAPQEQLIIPEALSDIYRKHPRAVLDLLVKIIDGANPNDSVVAAGYAVSLLHGPAVRIVCVDLFRKDTYDKVKKAWDTTPRIHWMRVVKRAREERRR
jgi:hypothetical protein